MNRHNSTFRIKASRLKRSPMKRKPKVRAGKVTLRAKPESPKLKKWRRECRERDNFTCQFPGCGRYSKLIDVHHIAKRSQRPDLKFEVSNGVCLCREHHAWTDLNHDEAVSLGLLSTESYELANKPKAA